MGANGGANGLCPGYGSQDLMALENGWVLKSIYASSFSAMYMIWCQQPSTRCKSEELVHKQEKK